MKKLVVYRTKHGSTKKYAEWIAKESKSDIVDMKGGKHIDFDHYGKILIGCPIYAGNVLGSDFIKKNWGKLKDKKMGVFTVSGHETDSDDTKNSYSRSFPEGIRKKVKDFHLRGKISFKDLGFFEGLLLRMMGVKEMNGVKKENIKPIVKFMK